MGLLTFFPFRIVWIQKHFQTLRPEKGALSVIDIHCHILPGVDDGSDSLETSLAMAEMAAASGVEAIAATPHCNIPGLEGNYADRALLEAVLALRAAVKQAGIGLQIFAGAEIFYTPEVPDLIDARRLPTLNASRYLLVEFPFDAPADYMTDGLDAIRARGLTPVVAHPERYFAVQLDPELFAMWFSSGFILQLNKDSILGRLGARAQAAAHWALQRGLAHAVASDAHGAQARTPALASVFDALCAQYGAPYASLLLDGNPRRLLNDRPPAAV